jgi:hypothetical protein
MLYTTDELVWWPNLGGTNRSALFNISAGITLGKTL